MCPRQLFASLWLCATLVSFSADASVSTVPTTWRLLDYIAVDYREAVRDGVIVNQGEYDEMREFSGTASASIEALPATAGSADLKARAANLQYLIQTKKPPEEIAVQARSLAALLVQHYPIPLMPTAPPQYERGKVLYAQLCAACHGAGGAGDGPASAGLDPAPIDFTDQGRAKERSVFALYQVIDQGLEGTSMVSYAGLPVEDRWALATYVGAIAYPESRVQTGRALLENDRAIRATLTMERYIGVTPAALADELGEAKAQAAVAYVRRHPDAALVPDAESSLAAARDALKQSMSAYRSGDAKRAKDLALAAYLDGFEPVEPLLAARDNPLMVKVEAAMARIRTGIAGDISPDELQMQVDALDGLFTDAESVLSRQQTSSASNFIAAFTILLREGLEALLIVVAIIALLRKAERTEMLRWVHAGWLSALLAGAVTWALATWVITISGASRELTEGVGSLLAAVVLVWVGTWMHGKSHADAWQRYVREKLGHVLSRQSGIFLLGLVFIVVYREVFETLLFFAAIWNQGGQASVVGGGVTAVLVLFAVGWMMMRYSRSLRLDQFFRYSAWLIAVLAVVLAGKAVSALQEAGYLPVSWFEGGLRVELLGIYPTLQGVAAQVGIALLLAIGFFLSSRNTQSVHAKP